MKKFFFIVFIFLSGKLVAQLSPESLGIKLTKFIPCTPVKDQYMSSTCWSFASNSFIESEVFLKTKEKADLSEMYIARYSYINKVYQYLAQNGKTYFTPGGQYHDVLKVIKQYGMMPEEAYNGKAHAEINHDHTLLDTLMKQLTDSLLQQHKLKPSAEDIAYINKVLDEYLGKVPATFIYKGVMYTPQTFAKNALHFNADDYIEITSYTHHPFYKPFVLEDKYNWTLDKYFNVPLNVFVQITDAALANGYTVCWDGDVTETGFQYEKGIAMLNFPVKDFQKGRQVTYEDKSTTIDHMMHIAGTATDKQNHKWYYVKNSWGDYSNALGGYLFMQDDYFKIKTVAIIVNKNAIPIAIRKRMKL